MDFSNWQDESIPRLCANFNLISKVKLLKEELGRISERPRRLRSIRSNTHSVCIRVSVGSSGMKMLSLNSSSLMIFPFPSAPERTDSLLPGVTVSSRGDVMVSWEMKMFHST